MSSKKKDKDDDIKGFEDFIEETPFMRAPKANPTIQFQEKMTFLEMEKDRLHCLNNSFKDKFKRYSNLSSSAKLIGQQLESNAKNRLKIRETISRPESIFVKAITGIYEAHFIKD